METRGDAYCTLCSVLASETVWSAAGSRTHSAIRVIKVPAYMRIKPGCNACQDKIDMMLWAVLGVSCDTQGEVLMHI